MFKLYGESAIEWGNSNNMVVLLIVLGLSLCLNIYLYMKRNAHYKQLEYIHLKLQRIVLEKTEEKLLLYTENSQIQSVLTQINRLLDYNQIMAADYNRIERSMRRMLSNISHDIKTPLTVILGYTEMMTNDESLSPQQMNSLLNIVNLKAEEVIGLINKFFELAKLESEDKTVEVSKVNINEICRKKILDYYDIVSSEDFKVSILIPEESYYAFVNTVEMERVLDNLLSNAIKYGADGRMVGVEVKADKGHIYIVVSDQGKGIDEIHKEHVFDRMYTMDDSRNSRYQGSGLGLTITKTLVEKMGGEILLESTPYERTAFTVKLNRFIG